MDSCCFVLLASAGRAVRIRRPGSRQRWQSIIAADRMCICETCEVPARQCAGFPRQTAPGARTGFLSTAGQNCRYIRRDLRPQERNTMRTEPAHAPFLLLSIRAEDQAADDEYQAMMRFARLDASGLHRIRLTHSPLGPIDLAEWSGIILGGGP